MCCQLAAKTQVLKSQRYFFENFDPSRRIEVDLQSLPWIILPTLMQEAEQLKKELEERRLQKRTAPEERGRGKKRRKQEALRVTDPW